MKVVVLSGSPRKNGNTQIMMKHVLEYVNQKGVEVIFSKIKSSNHFFKNKEKELTVEIEKYIKEKTALI